MPALAHRLLRAGAFGVTCAKVSEAEVLVEAGITDVLIANQVVGATKTRPPGPAVHAGRRGGGGGQPGRGGRARARGAGGGDGPRVVVEVDVGMDRCGVPPGEPALRLAQEVADSAPALRRGDGLGGAHGALPDAEAKVRAIRAVGLLAETAQACATPAWRCRSSPAGAPAPTRPPPTWPG